MARTHLHRVVPRQTLALVGGDSLLGKEVRELIDSSELPVDLKLIASDEDSDTNIIAAARDEPVVMSSLALGEAVAAKLLILAGSMESSRKAYEQVRGAKPAPVIVDLSGALEEQPNARLRAPLIETSESSGDEGVQVIAHPAAIALAMLLMRLGQAGAIRHSIAEIFEPVSERGQAGIEELQKQTVALLSFKALPKEVFDTQVSFTMAPEYGSDSRHSLASVEVKIERHLASLLAANGNIAMPSLRVIHAPVFHGYSISAWVEFDENPTIEAIVNALTTNNIDVRTGDQEPPSNVGVAGQGGITVGAIRPDRNRAHAFWFWIAADNLRIVAENAVEVVRGLVK